MPGLRAIAAALLIAAPLPLASQVAPGAGVEVEPAAIQIGAVRALDEGRTAEARALAEALLVRDPHDLIALTVLSQAAFATGDFATARRAAAQLYRSDIPQQRRYEAARLAALAALNEDRLTLSGWWLRAALTQAPTPEAAAQTREDAAGVRRQNPWSTSVELSFAPSNNVNGGAQTSSFEIDGIDLPGFLTGGAISRAGQALSGWTGFVDLRTAYRLQEDRDSRTQAGLRLRYEASFLSEEARAFLDAGSEADRAFGNDDLTSALVEVRLSHDRLAAQGTVGLEAVLGAAWTQGDYAYTYARLSANRVYNLSQADALRGAVFAETRIDTSDLYDDSDRYSVQGTWFHGFAGGARIASTLGYTVTDSPNTQLAQDATLVQFTFTPAEPIGPAAMSYTIGAERTQVPDYQFFGAGIPGGRADQRYFVAVDAFFADLDYAGFAPVVTFDAATTDSNVSRFDREDFGIGLNFRSTF